MTKLLTILTIRTSSSRLPGKALAPITSRVPGSSRKVTLPLAVWILRRLRQMDTMICVATPESSSDVQLAKVLQNEGVEVIRGSTDDVIGRMDAVIQTGQYSGAGYIFRALGDCPFISWQTVEYSAKVLERTNKEAMAYCLPPDVISCYGSREFCYSLSGWSKIVRNSTFREHPDMYFHLNRDKFNVLLHIAPDNIFMRPYRLEVDWEADLELVRAIADEVGMLADLRDVIKLLDRRPDLARINAHLTEKTGPLSLNTYDNGQRRKWLLNMIGRRIYTWQGEWVTPPDPKATPTFCHCGELIGWGWRGSLHMRDGSVMQRGFPRCKNCGLVVREWREAIVPTTY